MIHQSLSMLALMVLLGTLFGQLPQSVESLELRYKVCTAEELRRSVEQFCMRLGRESNSLLSLDAYGSVSTRTNAYSDEALMGVLKLSRPYVRQHGTRVVLLGARRASQQLVKRGQDSSIGTEELCTYLDSCCNQSCVIDPEDLAPYCTAI